MVTILPSVLLSLLGYGWCFAIAVIWSLFISDRECISGNVFPEMYFREDISENVFLFMTDSICESSLVTKIWTGNGVIDR